VQPVEYIPCVLLPLCLFPRCVKLSITVTIYRQNARCEVLCIQKCAMNTKLEVNNELRYSSEDSYFLKSMSWNMNTWQLTCVSEFIACISPLECRREFYVTLCLLLSILSCVSHAFLFEHEKVLIWRLLPLLSSITDYTPERIYF